MKPPTSTSMATAPHARTRQGSPGAGVSGTTSSIIFLSSRARCGSASSARNRPLLWYSSI
ncbi:MAG: hypothetical protein H7276_03900 [Caulobacter sp.]|nr:hypothetical protein [Vitreoscilla sp.]